MGKLNPFSLQGRRVLLTGACGHLGTAMAEGLSLAGAELLLAGRSLPKLTALAEKLNARNGCGRAYPIVLDITDDESCRAVTERIHVEFQSLHGIVNNAYNGCGGSLEIIKEADFYSACALNLVGPFRLVQLLLDILTESAKQVEGGVSIVNVASMYGFVSPNPQIYDDDLTCNPIHYGATKAGLIQMTRYMACHLANRGIRVNSLSPGACPSLEVQTSNPNFVNLLEAKAPMGRIGQADEIAHPVQFLLSPASSYITGADLRVDGGWTAW